MKILGFSLNPSTWRANTYILVSFYEKYKFALKLHILNSGFKTWIYILIMHLQF